ncbi:hypothetical protein N0Y54_43905 [Nostoc punctiforme UO1]
MRWRNRHESLAIALVAAIALKATSNQKPLFLIVAVCHTRTINFLHRLE